MSLLEESLNHEKVRARSLKITDDEFFLVISSIKSYQERKEHTQSVARLHMTDQNDEKVRKEAAARLEHVTHEVEDLKRLYEYLLTSYLEL